MKKNATQTQRAKEFNKRKLLACACEKWGKNDYITYDLRLMAKSGETYELIKKCYDMYVAIETEDFGFNFA